MERYYILAICTTKNCTEYDGGWIQKRSDNLSALQKLSDDYNDDSVISDEVFCPECGELLTYIIEEK